MDLDQFVLNPGTLLVLVFGLVEVAKRLGVQGRWLTALSMALGITLALFYRLRELLPAWGAWIELGFFGLAAGLAASGVYDYLKARRKAPTSTPPASRQAALRSSSASGNASAATPGSARPQEPPYGRR